MSCLVGENEMDYGMNEISGIQWRLGRIFGRKMSECIFVMIEIVKKMRMVSIPSQNGVLKL